ncbi:hypothetical protein B0T18DRAFT_439097 [Schizothecium vesticola]|uniref:Fungal lipase-like domain-containing protein n=1 Tax=Schizothecium vesticola TaxID=314040 RepID=A0AA40EPD6_9PEZI|nr:hypothetical protein B0T18DRAFT_439097 [Schizothecium vesticola]
MMMHTVLACMEMAMMAAALPLCMMLPGAMFMTWLTVCAAMIMAMWWTLNSREQMHQCSAGSSGAEGWMMDHDAHSDEKWLFIGGMGTSSRHTHTSTLPLLCRLFARPLTCICLPTLGLPFDLLLLLLHRCCLPLPSRARRTLYFQLRVALLDDATHRCVLLAHHAGAVLAAQAVAQLCADLPADRLRKLEVYTFGCAAAEFVMPVGEGSMEMAGCEAEGVMAERKGVHVEHFAMAGDPMAQMGVLRSVRRDMAGRYCGGVFVMNGGMMGMGMGMGMGMMEGGGGGMMMKDYMMAMFPGQMGGGGSAASMMDCVMHVDRDCAEKREIAAMACYQHAASGMDMKIGGGGGMMMMRGKGKRMSWTGLAVGNMNGMGAGEQKNGMSAGQMGLEMARKGCQGCKGHMGREVSWLARTGMGMDGGKTGLGMMGMADRGKKAMGEEGMKAGN